MVVASPGWAPDGFQAKAQQGASDTAASPIMGERPDPPRRLTGPSQVEAPGRAASAGAAAGPSANLMLDRSDVANWGAFTWFGVICIGLALAMLAAGLVGVFERRSRRLGLGAGRRSGSHRDRLRAARSAPASEEQQPHRPAASTLHGAAPRSALKNAAESEVGDARQSNHKTKQRGGAAALTLEQALSQEAVGILELLDELSPRRRRAAALAYGARKTSSDAGLAASESPAGLPRQNGDERRASATAESVAAPLIAWPTSDTLADTNATVADETRNGTALYSLNASRAVGPSEAEEGRAEASAVFNRETTHAGAAPEYAEQPADPAASSAEIADRILRFSKTKAARRDWERRG